MGSKHYLRFDGDYSRDLVDYSLPNANWTWKFGKHFCLKEHLIKCVWMHRICCLVNLGFIVLPKRQVTISPIRCIISTMQLGEKPHSVWLQKFIMVDEYSVEYVFLVRPTLVDFRISSAPWCLNQDISHRWWSWSNWRWSKYWKGMLRRRIVGSRI